MNAHLTDYLDTFRIAAAKIFAANPKLRSVLLGVAQYWADEAGDAVHSTVIASEREHIPLWPHRCAASVYDEELANIEGEACGSCGSGVPAWLEKWDDNGTAVLAFQPWCHEAGSQEEPEFQNALPAIVARKREGSDDIEVSFVGRIERIEDLLRGVVREDDEDFDDEAAEVEMADFDEVVRLPADSAWNDPRARELFAQVCEHPRDDAPRRVLADYLLERNVPLGELIALSLDKHASRDAKARYEHLYDELVPALLAPLARVVPAETAKLERGFLAEVDVWATEAHAESVRGHLVWNSVERIRVHGGESILHPSMRALRTLGPVDVVWLDALLSAADPWAIEELDIGDVELSLGEDLDRLRDTKLLPALRRLTLPEGSLAATTALSRAGWWKQVERLTIRVDPIVSNTDKPFEWWIEQRAELGTPWLALVQHFTDPSTADGWEIAIGPARAIEVTMRGFTPHASLDALRELVAPIRDRVKLVASEYYEPSPADLAYIGNSRLTI